MGVFNGGVDEVGDALQLHKDKEEFVRVGGPKLHKSPPPKVCSGGGGFMACSQAGGSWLELMNCHLHSAGVMSWPQTNSVA